MRGDGRGEKDKKGEMIDSEGRWMRRKRQRRRDERQGGEMDEKKETKKERV